MSETPWRIAIERALTLHGDDPASRWVQLATVAPDGRPAVRTVVFRGFLGGGDALRFTTDARSAKAEQLAHTAFAEVCWLFPERREQFRLAGRLELIGDGHPDPALSADRAATWAALPTPSRLTFAWPDPGAPRAEARRFRVAPPDPIHPPPSFGLLLLDPDRVDHLDLHADPHDRIRYQRPIADDGVSGAWEAVAINP